MLKKIGKGILPLFILCLGAGVLLGFTYRVVATPSSAPVLKNEVQTVYNTGLQPQGQQTQTQAKADPKAQEGDIFRQKGCIQCHSVSFYNIKGGATGPDLTIAYEDANKRFGKSLEEFLNKPEGTMGELLPKLTTPDDRKQILKLLTKAAGVEVKEDSAKQTDANKTEAKQADGQSNAKS